MTATTTEYTAPPTSSKHGTAKTWLRRHLRKVASRQTLRGGGENDGAQRRTSLNRPRTAPSIGATPISDTLPAAPSIPIGFEQVSPHPPILPPLRPPRPDSGVIRDVNAWLDASMNTPSPPLMGGLSYWKAATVPGVKDSAIAQHAIPLIKALPSTGNDQQEKSFRRCAKKMQSQMPSLLRTRSQRPASRKQMNRESASMPVMALPYDNVQQGTAPILIERSSSLIRPATRPSTRNATARTNTLLSAGQYSREHLPFRQDTPASTRPGDTESVFERRFNALLMRAARSADSTRPSTAAAGLTREDSMGDLSDAPTYFSGPPPPSYRSRPESVLTTSSFGCIDGMNPQQRQISQQRAAEQRGMKCKIRKFAQNFVT